MFGQAVPQPEGAGGTLEAPRSILIIDDDTDMVEVLAMRFRRQGFEVETSHEGGRGLELAREVHPHLILLDLRLPDVDGLAICQQLTDDPSTCDIPVIIVSGMEKSDIIRQTRCAGCQYYVRKPYDPNALLVLVERALDDAETWDDE
jgi:DNA-binding response OmpR family regulator